MTNQGVLSPEPRTSARSQRDVPDIGSETLAEDVYRVVRHRVASGLLIPGKHVSEHALSKELGVSRGPVREAIGRLTGEGLLERKPNAGAFVKKPNRKDLEELWQLRSWIESEATAQAATRITDEELTELQRCCDQMRDAIYHQRDSGDMVMAKPDVERRTTADAAFHLALMKASGNARAVRILANEQAVSRALALATVRVPQLLAYTVAGYHEHVEILRAVRSRDPDLARARMREHIANGQERLLSDFDRWATGPRPGNLPTGLREQLRKIEASEGPVNFK